MMPKEGSVKRIHPKTDPKELHQRQARSLLNINNINDDGEPYQQLRAKGIKPSSDKSLTNSARLKRTFYQVNTADSTSYRHGYPTLDGSMRFIGGCFCTSSAVRIRAQHETVSSAFRTMKQIKLSSPGFCTLQLDECFHSVATNFRLFYRLNVRVRASGLGSTPLRFLLSA